MNIDSLFVFGIEILVALGLGEEFPFDVAHVVLPRFCKQLFHFFCWLRLGLLRSLGSHLGWLCWLVEITKFLVACPHETGFLGSKLLVGLLRSIGGDHLSGLDHRRSGISLKVDGVAAPKARVVGHAQEHSSGEVSQSRVDLVKFDVASRAIRNRKVLGVLSESELANSLEFRHEFKHPSARAHFEQLNGLGLSADREVESRWVHDH